MLVPVLLFAAGLVCLIKGGDWFVDGATVVVCDLAAFLLCAAAGRR